LLNKCKGKQCTKSLETGQHEIERENIITLNTRLKEICSYVQMTMHFLFFELLQGN